MDPNALTSLWIAVVAAVAGLLGKWHERRSASQDKQEDREAEEMRTLIDSYQEDREAEQRARAEDRAYIKELVTSYRKVVGENTTLTTEKGRLQSAVENLKRQLNDQNSTIEELRQQVQIQAVAIEHMAVALEKVGIRMEDLLEASPDYDNDGADSE